MGIFLIFGKMPMLPCVRLAQLGELHLRTLLLLDALVGAFENASAHRGRDGVADHAVEPVVVVRLRAHLPLLDLAPASFGLDAVLGGEMLGEEDELRC